MRNLTRHRGLIRAALATFAVATVLTSMVSSPAKVGANHLPPDGYYQSNSVAGYCITPRAASPEGQDYVPDHNATGAGDTLAWFATLYGTRSTGAGYPGAITLDALPANGDPLDVSKSIDFDMTAAEGGGVGDHPPNDFALANALLAFANNNPGPWTLQVNIAPGPYVAGQNYTGQVIVKNANGGTVDVNGLPINVTGANNVNVPGGTTSAGVYNFTFTPTNPGGFDATFTANVPGVATVFTQTPDGFAGGYQYLLPPFSADTSGRFSGTAVPNFAITTAASPNVILGNPIHDTAILTGQGVAVGLITFTLYGPDNATCTGPGIFNSMVPVTGIANYDSAPFVPTAVGVYRWIERYVGTPNAVSGQCGDTNESVTVNKIPVTVLTNASAPVPLGGQIHDTATLSGSAPGPSPPKATGTITFALFGPTTATSPSCAPATPVFISTPVPVSGNGDYVSPPFTPTVVGTYTWVEVYSGDTTHSAVVGKCQDTNESVNVIQILTNASPEVTVGGKIHDTATLKGGTAATGTITFNLYGPDNASCSGTPVFRSITVVGGNGDYASAEFAPSLPGKYTWIETYSGGNNNAAVTGTCQDTNEGVVVKPPIQITTQASQTVELGGPIHDTATVAGGAQPTGTITFNLYGPDNATCSGVPIFTTATPISDNGVYASAEFTPSAPGNYMWVEVYSGDTRNGATLPVCNEVNEGVIVSAVAGVAVEVPTTGAGGQPSTAAGGLVHVNSGQGGWLLVAALSLLGLLGGAWPLLRRRHSQELAS